MNPEARSASDCPAAQGVRFVHACRRRRSYRRHAAPPLPGRLLLLRHGESSDNQTGVFSGSRDPVLTCRGREEAARAGWALEQLQVDLVLASTRRRAQETARIALRAAGLEQLPMAALPDLDERCVGLLEGLPKAQVDQMLGAERLAAWRADRAPGGESLADVKSRVLRVYEERVLPRIRAGGRVLLVSHANVFRCLLWHQTEACAADASQAQVPNGLVLSLRVDASGRCACSRAD